MGSDGSMETDECKAVDEALCDWFTPLFNCGITGLPDDSSKALVQPGQCRWDKDLGRTRA